VIALSRDPERAAEVLGAGVHTAAWREPTAAPPPADALAGVDAVVHLLGEPVAQRWSAAAKQAIWDSRVFSTRCLVRALRDLPDDERPATLIAQSATGYYGPRGSERLDEHATPGHDFLAKVVVAWEQEATAAAEVMRVAMTRTGVVLASEGGALATMLPFFRLGLGGPVAGGQQFVPWIHLDDVVGALTRCLDDRALDGPVNLTAPTPVSNHDFSRALGRALGRPAVLPVPGFALRLLYGEMAQVVTTGQRVIPARLEAAGYRFEHRDVEEALAALLRR
jgi:uncharacterized protein (TIGR01777 family)